MTWTLKPGSRSGALLTLILLCLSLARVARSDTITLKSGIVYRSQGSPDRDGTLVFLWDGLKRTVIRDSKIERVVGDSAFRTGEKFQIVQPLVVHGGAMPKEVISVQAGPWNDKGRRTFRYVGSNPNRPVSMEQALIEIGPRMVKYRGVDGFWVGQLAISQVPRGVIAGLLAQVEQNNQAERERVVRFLMDAGWYTEARAELDRLIHDFPRTDLADRAAGARGFIIQAAANDRRAEVDQCRRAQQFRAANSLLASFNEKEIGTELWIEVRDLLRRDDQLRASDTALANALHKLEGKLPMATRGAWKNRLAEVTKALEEAPDAVRGRFGAWRKAIAAASLGDESLLALAMSGFVVGSDSAVAELKLADALWQARDLIHDYLAADEANARESIVAKLEGLGWPGGEGLPEGYRKLELATRLVGLMPPPLADSAQEPGKPLLHKLNEDKEQAATEYIVRLPPEYHPLRTYPALLVVHSGQGPQSAVDAWSAEASRRGYIIIAPEYALPGQHADYHYSPSEHAAVEIALRDALRRYAIDSDRVFIAGQLSGGNMAWDLALGHPDLFAGAVVVSGAPAYYVPRYLGQHERVPLYFIIGDLAPAATEIFFGNYLKPMILKGWDVTYVEYHRRGLEEFPEEIPTIFDWMDHHRRDPVPKSFDVVTARTCDNRFYGVVVHEFSAGRATAPEAVEILGQNLSPATLKIRTSALGNLLNLKSAGIMKLDVWVSPRIIDFKRKLEVRVNDKPRFKGPAPLLLEPLLEDLRLRGDRQQVYWMKVAVG